MFPIRRINYQTFRILEISTTPISTYAFYMFSSRINVPIFFENNYGIHRNQLAQLGALVVFENNIFCFEEI